MLDAAAAMGVGASDFDAQAIMQQMAAEDPRMAMLLQMMQPPASRAVNDDLEPDEPEEPDERDEMIAELGERLDAAEARLTKMTRIARRLHEAHKIDSERLQNLAAALGACGICWGDDDGCPGCRGRGRIGMVRPDLELRAGLFGHEQAPRSHGRRAAAPQRPGNPTDVQPHYPAY